MKITRFIFIILTLVAVENPWAQIKIMPLGDSITDGEFGSTDNTGYRRTLYHLLQDSGYEVDFVGGLTGGIPLDFDRNHEGHNGFKIGEIEAEAYLTVNPAQIILLHIGTNDIRKNSLYTTSADVEALLDEIETWEIANDRTAVVILAEIINMDGHECPNASTVTTFNNNVKAMAETRINDRIVLIDMECSAGFDYSADLADTVHPNDAGYVKMAEKWFADGLLAVLPHADAGLDQNVKEGALVALDGSGSTDPDGASLNYLWEQLPSGTKVTLSDVKHQRPTFVAPGVGVSGEKLEFKLTVTDTDGFQHKDSVSVNVSNSLLTPIVDAGVDQSVTEGETVTLNGSNSYDPDGTLSSVVWEQVSANNHIDLKPPDELTTQFVAPEVDADGDVLEFKLTVTDDDGLTGEDTVKVTIAPETVSASAGNGNGSGGGGCFIQTAAN